jgi:hypothetical protein
VKLPRRRREVKLIGVLPDQAVRELAFLVNDTPDWYSHELRRRIMMVLENYREHLIDNDVLPEYLSWALMYKIRQFQQFT